MSNRIIPRGIVTPATRALTRRGAAAVARVLPRLARLLATLGLA